MLQIICKLLRNKWQGNDLQIGFAQIFHHPNRTIGGNCCPQLFLGPLPLWRCFMYYHLQIIKYKSFPALKWCVIPPTCFTVLPLFFWWFDITVLQSSQLQGQIPISGQFVPPGLLHVFWKYNQHIKTMIFFFLHCHLSIKGQCFPFPQRRGSRVKNQSSKISQGFAWLPNGFKENLLCIHSCHKSPLFCCWFLNTRTVYKWTNLC